MKTKENPLDYLGAWKEWTKSDFEQIEKEVRSIDKLNARKEKLSSMREKGKSKNKIKGKSL